MAVNGIELEVGQVWLTVDDRKVTITYGPMPNLSYPWEISYGDNCNDYITDDGYIDKEDEGPYLKTLVGIVDNTEKQTSSEKKYTVREVTEAVEKITYYCPFDGWEEVNKKVEKFLELKDDPEYHKYLELKAKYENT